MPEPDHNAKMLAALAHASWFAYDVWMGLRAYQGEWAGYPGIGHIGRPELPAA